MKAVRRLATVSVFMVAFVAVVSAGHSWNGYHWERGTNPITLDLGNNLGSHWQTHFTNGLIDWNNRGGGVLNLQAAAGGANPKNCRPGDGRIEVCSDSYGNTGWLGIAQIWVSGSHITKASAKMNDYYMGPAGFYPYTTATWRQYVLCQEIGHDFGLTHQNEIFDNPNTGSCMDYTDDPSGATRGGLSNESPNQHDTAELVAIYTHLDGGAPPCRGRGCGALPSPAMGQGDPATGAQWGRLVRSSANGRGQTYELDFGGGNRLITFVLRVDPAVVR